MPRAIGRDGQWYEAFGKGFTALLENGLLSSQAAKGTARARGKADATVDFPLLAGFSLTVDC